MKTMQYARGSRLGWAGCVATWIGLAACNPEAIEYPDVGTGGAGAAGASSASGGKVAGEGGAPTSGGKQGSGGTTGNANDFPWPVLPTARGTVTDILPWDIAATGCCSRVPGQAEQSSRCPVGFDQRLEKTTNSEPDQIYSVRFAFKEGDNGHPLVVSGTFGEPTRVGGMVTTVLPPSNILDETPVFWVGTESGAFPEGTVVSLAPKGYTTVATSSRGIHHSLYFSEDGVEFVELPPSNDEIIGPTAYIQGSGFIVAGVGPDVLRCQPPLK